MTVRGTLAYSAGITLVSHGSDSWMRSLLRVLVIVVLLMASSDALSANDYCRFPTVPNTDDGYRMRGDRCEGIHAIEVASFGMVPISFTSCFDEFATGTPSTMKLSWPAGGDDSIVISGGGIRSGAHYAMDTVVAPAAGTFSWSADIINRRQFRRADLGFLAWREFESNGYSLKKYVPLGVAHSASSKATCREQDGVYTIAFRPGERFSKMHTTLERICNGTVDVVEERTELGRKYYSTEKVVYALAIPESVGLYRIRIEGERDNGTHGQPLVFMFAQKNGVGEVPCD